MSIAAMGWVVQISCVHQKFSLDLMKKSKNQNEGNWDNGKIVDVLLWTKCM